MPGMRMTPKLPLKVLDVAIVVTCAMHQIAPGTCRLFVASSRIYSIPHRAVSRFWHRPTVAASKNVSWAHQDKNWQQAKAQHKGRTNNRLDLHTGQHNEGWCIGCQAMLSGRQSLYQSNTRSMVFRTLRRQMSAVLLMQPLTNMAVCADKAWSAKQGCMLGCRGPTKADRLYPACHHLNRTRIAGDPKWASCSYRARI